MTRRLGSAALVVLALSFGAMGCAPEPESPSVAPTTSAPPATTTPTPAPPTEDPWVRFVDDRMVYSFETPPGWTVEEVPSAYTPEELLQYVIRDPDGAEQLYFSSAVIGLGGSCESLPALGLEELDVVPAEIPGYVPAADTSFTPLVPPRVVFRAAETESGVIGSIALDDSQPIDACFIYNLLHPAAGPMTFADSTQVSANFPPRTFASMDEARAFVDTEEYATLQRILRSLRIG